MLYGCNVGDQQKDDLPTISQYEMLISAAASKSAEVQSLVDASPCTQSSQCSTLVLQHQQPPCFFNDRYDYSLASPTAAAASAAASEYNALAAQASAVRPPSNISGSCSQNVTLMPLNCVANRCIRQFVVSAPVPGPQTEGVWTSATFKMFVSLVGTIWAVDIGALEPTVYTGALSQRDTALSATLERTSGSTTTASSLVATISDAAPRSIAISSLGGVASVPMTLLESSTFFSASDLNQVAGAYTLSTGERIVLESSGIVRSSDSGCTITGSVSATWSDRNVYHLGFVFGPAPCRHPNALIQGVLAPLTNSGQLAVVKRVGPGVGAEVAAITMTRIN
jgi:hypothetical protein